MSSRSDIPRSYDAAVQEVSHHGGGEALLLIKQMLDPGALRRSFGDLSRWQGRLLRPRQKSEHRFHGQRHGHRPAKPCR
jgi:hypothetical protein